MSGEIFLDKSVEPESADLKQNLGSVYPIYQEIMAIAELFKKEWKFYGKTGWQLKVHDSKKALFYLTPMKSAFRIGLAIREEEKEMLLQSGLDEAGKKAVEEAQKFPEGFALRFSITEAKDAGLLLQVLTLIVPLRKK